MLSNNPLEDTNGVIIRVWTSGFNKGTPGASVGHVSIEIPKKGDKPHYFSLWPDRSAPHTSMGIFTPIQGTFHQYEDDIMAENRSPETTVCLYGLNVSFMKAEFTKISSDGANQEIGWVLIGGNRIINQGKGESCASLAWRLLKVAGIYEEISSSWSSKFSSIITPDNVGKAIMAAKKYELSKHPETKDFVYSEETNISDRNSCTMV